MGGSLAWTLRLSDGTEYRMNRWTNEMPHLIVHPDFLDEKPERISECLSSWLDLKADWEENRESGVFRNQIAGVYAPYPYGLRRSEYGLVVTDFQSRTILTHQDYSDLSRIMLPWIQFGCAPDRNMLGYFDRATAFERVGRVKHFEMIVEGEDIARALEELGARFETSARGNSLLAKIPGTVSLADLHAATRAIVARARDAWMLDPECNPRCYSAAMVFDPAPFSIENFSRFPDGWRRMHARIRDIGLALTPREAGTWEAELAEYDREQDKERIRQ